MHWPIPGLGIELELFKGDLDAPELGGPGIIGLVEKTTDRIEIIQASWLRLRIYRLLNDSMFTKTVTTKYPVNPLEHLEIYCRSSDLRKRLVENATIGRWIDRKGEIKRAQDIVSSIRRLGDDYEEQLVRDLGHEQLLVIKEVSKRSYEDVE